MAKRSRSTGSSAIARRLAEGRGQGRGRNYRPWLLVQDVPSTGNASRVWSPITEREHHLMSNLERDYFLVAHAQKGLRDYREQFPLLPLEETMAIARGLGIDHPADPRTHEPIVMTSDFVLTIADEPGELNFAFAIKPAAQLSSSRVLEKLEVERIFWQSRKVDWSIVTERELPKILLRNMRWTFPCFQLPRFCDLAPHEVDRIRTTMEPAAVAGRQPLVEITSHCDAALGLKSGTALLLARYFIASQQWVVDLNQPINPRHPLRLQLLGLSP